MTWSTNSTKFLTAPSISVTSMLTSFYSYSKASAFVRFCGRQCDPFFNKKAFSLFCAKMEQWERAF